MEIQRIKTFVQVKKRRELVRAMGNLTELNKAMKVRFNWLNSRVEELEKNNEMLKKVNQEINDTIINRIKSVEFESNQIKAER